MRGAAQDDVADDANASRPPPAGNEPAGDRAGAPPEPPPPVRGEGVFRRLDGACAWIDGWIARWVPVEFNPLAQAGAAANVALLVAVATGVLLLIWYSPSVQFAHASLDSLRGWTLGGWVRAMHRYSSDLAMLLLLVHAARVGVARKFAGARWLAWVSGIGMLALIWFIGWTGYWLVWDEAAREIAVSSIRVLDALPIFGEPLGRLFVSDRTVPSLLFFVVFFLHMLLPLAIAVGLAVHLTRLSRARLLPRREVAWALVAALAVASLVVPAPLGAAARMAAKPEVLAVDPWYLAPLALALRFQHAGPWVAMVGGVALAALMPWLLGRRRRPGTFQAVVDVSRCHACAQCVQDCPFDAITMVDRTDGKRFPSQAQVDPARCVGCGVCAGSCDSEGIGLTWFDTRIQEARLEREIETACVRAGAHHVALVAAEIRRPLPELPAFDVHRVPTASWVRPKFLERLFAAGVQGVLVVRDARAEAWARDGGRWVEARLAGGRKPRLRTERIGSGRWSVIDFDPARPAELIRCAGEFRRGGGGARPSERGPRALAFLTLLVLAGAATVIPSRWQVTNPAPATPELVLSLKAFGARVAAEAAEAAVEAAKPVHMRGRALGKPRRAAVVVRLTVDGATEERTFAAKGLAHDGPAIVDWRRPWGAGDHHVRVEIATGPGEPAARWEGTVRAAERRLKVVRYDPATGFVIE